jgi:L-asparaginase
MPLSVACQKTLNALKPYDGFAGVIAISEKGEIYHADTHPYMVWASHDGEVDVFE